MGGCGEQNRYEPEQSRVPLPLSRSEDNSNFCGVDKVCFSTTHSKSRFQKKEFLCGSRGEYFAKSTRSLPVTYSSSPEVHRDSLNKGPGVFLLFSIFLTSFPPSFSFPVASGPYALHITLYICVKCSRRGATKVFNKLEEQNAISLTSPFDGSYFANISCWFPHHLSHHISLATPPVSSSPPCSFACKYTFKMFCFHALSR